MSSSLVLWLSESFLCFILILNWLWNPSDTELFSFLLDWMVVGSQSHFRWVWFAFFCKMYVTWKSSCGWWYVLSPISRLYMIVVFVKFVEHGSIHWGWWWVLKYYLALIWPLVVSTLPTRAFNWNLLELYVYISEEAQERTSDASESCWFGVY